MKSSCNRSTGVKARKGVYVESTTAGNAAELNMAAKLANDVNGAKGAKNRMTIE